MKQGKVGYISKPVLDGVRGFEDAQKLKMEGLIDSLITFDYFANFHLDPSTSVSSVYAVAFNIISRGTPTLASPFLESALSKSTGLTQENSNEFEIEFGRSESFDLNSVVRALHPIDSRKKNRRDYVNTDVLDSTFERDFLFKYIPESESYLPLVLDFQRARNTLGASNGNLGRVDFSLQIPYFDNDVRQNRYKKDTEVRFQKKYIVEVDGRRYHDLKIDALKDFELAELPNNTQHVREDTLFQDVYSFLRTISREDYLKILKTNFSKGLDDLLNYYLLMLTPLGVGRIQYLILKYLMSVSAKSLKGKLKLAVIERDLPCAALAIQDLEQLLSRLNSLVDESIEIPQIELSIYSSKEFVNHDLHLGVPTNLISGFKADGFDLVLDITLLSRFFTVRHTPEVKHNSLIVIGNSHYEDTSQKHSFISAESIKYKELVVEKDNEEYEEIPQTVDNLEYFIQLFFRKRKFRPGQLPILNRALRGKSVIGLLPTGGGKSLTYQLASLMQPGITVVVDPIRSLMLDQYNSLVKIGINRAEFVNSSKSGSERRYIQKSLTEGQLQFLFVSPERYVIKSFRDSLFEATQNEFYFSYAVIDEVHCVSEWGHEFRADYLKLGKNIVQFTKTKTGKSIPLFGLTATASYDVLADIERELEIQEDDGNAIVRYENTVRDEVNYQILQSSIPSHKLENLNPRAIRSEIGERKQKAAVRWIQDLQSRLTSFQPALPDILKTSFDSYLPDSIRKITSDQEYIQDQLKRLGLDDKTFNKDSKVEKVGSTEIEKTSFNSAIVVFCPHRTGALGVESFARIFEKDIPSESIGTFMGASDSVNSEEIDRASFENQEKFLANEQSIMVATKAFGMGIDKPNVRATVHANVPGSIESFVQETGRAGRDKKLSISAVFYSPKVHLKDDNEFFNDREVLDFFHRKSFKGKIKERQVIYELRNKITYPSASRLHLLQVEIAERLDKANIKLNINNNTLYLNDAEDNSYLGRMDLKSLAFSSSHELRSINSNDLTLIAALIKSRIESQSIDSRSSWLQDTVGIEPASGIETRLLEASYGEEIQMKIAFSNTYVSRKVDRIFILNADHFNKVLTVPVIKKLLLENQLSQESISNTLSNAVENDATFDQFIHSLTDSENLLVELMDETLERAYYLPRDKSDTAKAIYRLASIGVIDDYTVDFQNHIYYVTAIKKKPDQYFKNLGLLITRYTSRGFAEIQIERLHQEYDPLIENGKATEIGVCINYLTDFVYGQIADKRAQAIDDMINLCETALRIEDPFKQNSEIKDHIYYYFNAKYSRLNNFALKDDGEKTPASFFDDKEMNTFDLINKYLDLTEWDRTASLKTNIKHLRGACMRMLRVLPDHAGFRILKAYALIVLSENTQGLLKEAQKELLDGLVRWQQEEADLSVMEQFDLIEKKILSHINNKLVREVLSTVRSTFRIKYYAQWTSKFSNQFTKGLNYA
ncbi:DEAD/DEAH box helicase [Marinoscillum pacificum]|uniref:DEAD/DEAH box helicase n=1 Tax=Marinoscillum pacificum TaxID=392723 RepID=UPI00280BE7C1|nr:DEAD/DEAH box helicase [Marinoscillum pacificum]